MPVLWPSCQVNDDGVVADAVEVHELLALEPEVAGRPGRGPGSVAHGHQLRR